MNRIESCFSLVLLTLDFFSVHFRIVSHSALFHQQFSCAALLARIRAFNYLECCTRLTICSISLRIELLLVLLLLLLLARAFLCALFFVPISN